MCTFNGAAWVEQQLESIAAQERLPDELVICDDQSSDGTLELLKKFAAAAPFPVRILSNDIRLGVAGNFSQAISLCGGDFIALADQDDRWGPRKLSVLERCLIDQPAVGIVFSDANLVDEALLPLGTRLWDTLYLDLLQRSRLTNGQAIQVLTRTNVVTGATTMFRSCFKDMILPIPSCWIHDGWIALLISAASICAMVDEPLVDYRQHARQQIGARRASFLDQVRIGMEMDEAYFRLEALRWLEAYRRAAAYRQMFRFPEEDLATIAEKARFSQDRYRMRLESVDRWEAIARHWAEGDYHTMAWGWKSLLQDVVIQK